MASGIALIRNDIPPNKAIELSSFPFAMVFKQLGRLVLGISYPLLFLAMYIPWFYTTVYGRTTGASPSTTLYLSSALYAGTLVGRIVMGGIGDKIGPSNALLLCLLVSAFLVFVWQEVNSAANLFVWVTIYGWFSAAAISLQTPTVIAFVPEGKTQLIGPYITILCQLSSLGSLGGNPIAGALLQDRHGGQKTPYPPSDFHPIM